MSPEELLAYFCKICLAPCPSARTAAAPHRYRQPERSPCACTQTLADNYLPRVREHLGASELNVLFGNVSIRSGVNQTLLEQLNASRATRPLERQRRPSHPPLGPVT